MLEQLISRLQQCQDAIKICYQGSQVRQEKLSAEHIRNYIEKLFSDDAVITLDETELSVLNQCDEIKVRLIELDQVEFDEKILLVFNELKQMDCAVLDIACSELSLQSYGKITFALNECCSQDAQYFIGTRNGKESHLTLFLLGGYDLAAEIKPEKDLGNIQPDFNMDYSDEELVEKFMAELRHNPNVTISSLQRRYLLGFNRVVRLFDMARDKLQQKE